MSEIQDHCVGEKRKVFFSFVVMKIEIYNNVNFGSDTIPY